MKLSRFWTVALPLWVISLTAGYSFAADSVTPAESVVAQQKPTETVKTPKKPAKKKAKPVAKTSPESLSPTASADLTVTAQTTDTVSTTVTAQSLTVTAAVVSPTPTPDPSIPHRSPVLAGSLAFFPGVALHGVGHMYAGNWFKGLGLLALEGGATYLAYQHITVGMTEINDATGSVNSGSTIPTNFNPPLTHVGVLLVCTATWIFTWWDDMAGAPKAARSFNDRAAAEYSSQRISLVPSIHNDETRLSLVTSF